MTSPKRLLAPLAVLVALLALPAGAQAKYTLGVSDQQASTFTNKLFKPLKLKAARYIAPYDVMSSPVDRGEMDAWLRAARTAKVRVLVTFQHSAAAPQGAPAALDDRVQAGDHGLPQGVPVGPRGLALERGQPLPDRRPTPPASRPAARRSAWPQYYALTRKVFGKGTTVVALDVLDEANVSKTLKVIRKFLRYAKPRPKILGFHNYSDTNRFSTSRTQAVLNTWGKDVWLTETGGIVRLGRSFKYSTSRAAKALGCMFTIARKFRHVKRLYVYQFNGAKRGPRFDAGLIDPEEQEAPRLHGGAEAQGAPLPQVARVP